MRDTQADITVPGFGIGLREPHMMQVLNERPRADWFEVITENVMGAHAGHLEYLRDLRKNYPLVLHGVGLSIGGTDPLNTDYLSSLKKLAGALSPMFISDHLCWTGIHGINSHDLLPVACTREALSHIAARVRQVQEYLGQRIALENPSTYAEFSASEMPEEEFIVRLAEEADCLILLDVNNVYVSARNHETSARDYIAAIPSRRIAYTHLAGHRDMGTHIIDTHDDHVAHDVWDLYAYTLQQHGPLSTLVEWDGNIPALDVLLAELDKARDISAHIFRAKSA